MKYTFEFKRELYSKEALIKAAYQFIDDFYLHLEADENYYFVNIEPKITTAEIEVKQFENELLIQETRKIIADKTHGLREMIFARAMASTIITDNETETVIDDNDVDDILVNWFDRYDE